jgi:hypothetical protein
LRTANPASTVNENSLLTRKKPMENCDTAWRLAVEVSE